MFIVDGRQRRERPRMKWAVCVKKDLVGLGGEDESEGWEGGGR